VTPGRFALMLCDVRMPGVSGVDVVSQAHAVDPHLAILMLSAATCHDGVRDAVCAGASGYLLKDAPLTEIVAGIRAAAVGDSAFAARVAGAMLDSVRRNAAPETDGPTGTDPRLSSRELQVLALLTQGLGNSEIAQRLSVSNNTVKIHIARLLGKLGVANRVQAATFATRHGLFDDALQAA